MLTNTSGKYVLREVLLPFLGGMAFFSFLLLMFQVFRLADLIVLHGAPLEIVLKLIGYILVSFFPISFPISFLLSVLSTFGRMSGDNEVVAFKAIGVSLYELLVPVLFLGVVVSFVCMYANFYMVPWGNRMFRHTVIKLENTKATSNIKEGTFTPGFFDLLVYAEKVDGKKNNLSGIFIYDERNKDNPITIISKRGRIINKKQSDLGSSILFRQYNGTIHRIKPGTINYHVIAFNTYDMNLIIEEGDVVDISKPKTLNYEELISGLDETLKKDPKAHRMLSIEYWKRIAISFSPIVLALLGVAFGTVRSRAVKSQSTVMSLGVMVLYWTLYVLGTQMGEKGVLPPVIAMWLANAVLLLISIPVLKRAAAR